MTFLIEFLGCKVNSYEVEAVAKTFLDNGYTLFDATKNDKVDVIIINTCAVTQTSITKDKKVIKRYRKTYPEAIICVMGCYSQYKASYIVNELGADIALGTSKRNEVYSLVEKFKKEHEKIILHEENNSIKKYEDMFVDKFLFNTRAYVKIQDGCNNFCTYCLIPYVRGRSRSRNKEDIIKEITTLVKNGHKEVVLTGVDMSSYGLDLVDKTTFSDLLEYILINVPDLYRLRISSLEESLIDDKFFYLLKKYDKLADHLHIPLQSGSEAVIKRMNRKYNLDAFINKVNKIREIRPDISITTDVIVGFPGESDENFNETYESCKLIKFSKIHVFPYSIREGTIAAKMKDQIPQEIKKERVHKLIALSDVLEEEYYSRFYDKEIDFLIEEYDSKKGAFKGHSSNYLCSYVNSSLDSKGQVVRTKFLKENSIKI